MRLVLVNVRRESKPGYIRERDGRLVPLSEWYLRFASKRKRRKGHYMRYYSHWESRHQSTKAQASRASRHDAKRQIREEDK